LVGRQVLCALALQPLPNPPPFWGREKRIAL
jgi:hypothetical protein